VKKILLLLDIDGTLLRAEGATHQAITETFQELFVVKASIDILSLIGPTDYGIFKDAAVKLLGRQLLDKELKVVTKRYLELLPEKLHTIPFHLMPGVKELLLLLADREDIVLGLETGNLKPAAYMKLKRGNIDQYFLFGGFGSDSEDRTELVRKGIERARALNHGTIANDNIYVIGDSPHDISAGRNLGVNTIAVGTGLIVKEKLLAEEPSFYLKDLNDIPAFLQCIGCAI
jgi:phosphoglycolate phosphatase